MDRGYPSYKVIEAFDKNAKFVIRIRKNSFKEAKELFESKEKEKIAIIKRPSNIDDKNIREKVKVRFVRVDLPNNEVEVLITNIFDKNFKQEDFKEIYARRWGIETFYDLIKNRLGLENFTGYSYDAIMQDFYITMLLTNLETMYTMDIKLQLKKNEEMKRLNKSVTFNAIKENIIGLFFREDLDLDTMINNLEKLFKSSIEIVRKKENKKRNKKEKTKEIRDSLHFHKRKKKVV